MRGKYLADQHPRDGTETDGEHHYEHAQGREWNERDVRDLDLALLQPEEAADQKRTDAHDDYGTREQHPPSQSVDNQGRNVRGDHGHGAEEYRALAGVRVLFVRTVRRSARLDRTAVVCCLYTRKRYTRR